MSQTRISLVCALLMMVAMQNSPAGAADDVELVGSSTVDEKTLTFAVGPAAKFSITVNGRTHQQTPVTTYRGYQYVTYFDAKRRVCIGRRKLPSKTWEVIHFDDHRFKTNDSHNTAVLGICDTDGTIHMAFDHHATELNYRVSKQGAAHNPESVQWNKDIFGPVTHTLGSVAPAPRVTYPRFFPAPNGNLMLYYRSVTSGNGDGMLEEYDGKKHDWTPGLGKVIARDIGTFTANGRESSCRCPYMNSLSYAGSRLHASWVWRDRFERTDPHNQHDLCYAYSDDDGRTWMNSSGKLIGTTGKDFIHLDSPGLVAASIPVGSGLTNQNTHFAYPDGCIHVVARQSTKPNIGRRYFHNWRNKDGQWNQEMLPFTGSRPKLVGANDRSLILVYSDEVEDDKEELRIALGQPNSDMANWKWSRLDLPNRYLIAGEPVLDLERWQQDQVLSIYFQEAPSKIIRTKQIDAVDGIPTSLNVVDYKLAREKN